MFVVLFVVVGDLLELCGEVLVGIFGDLVFGFDVDDEV